MPTLSGVSSTDQLTAQIGQLFDPNLVTSNTSTRVVAENATTSYVFTGTGLVATTFQGFLAGFSAGTLDTLTIRSAVDNSLLASMSGLNIDVLTANSIFDDAGALAIYLADLVWQITGTGGIDTYNLSDLSGFHTTGRNVINLLGGNDNVTGGFGVDVIDSGTGNDKIYDSKGNDVARGGLGDDLLGLAAGATGNDKLYGDIGNDSIAGGVGKDKLYGGAGNDDLSGGTGDDLMSGGKGRDTQDGGAGADTFLFGMSDGADLINNFDLDLDVLRINLTGTTTTVRISEVAGDAVIKFGTTTITLDGIAKADLVIGDHIILI